MKWFRRTPKFGDQGDHIYLLFNCNRAQENIKEQFIAPAADYQVHKSAETRARATGL